MLSTNYFIHLFFDYDHDTHYTDTLLALEPEAYLWYKLKLSHGFDGILFFDCEYGELRVQTFDSFSKQLADKKGFLDAVLKKSEEDMEIESCVQPVKREFSLDDLLKITERKELKGRKAAFVLSLSALSYFYRGSDQRTVEKLKRKIETPDGKSIMVIRIPPQTAKIREAFFAEDAALPRISRKISAVLNGVPESITDALARHMKEQIIYGYRIDDAFNMLLKTAAEKDDWTDSPEDLKKQAEYLQLSFNICGRLPAEKRGDGSSSAFVKHRELYEQLKNGKFRQLVRSETKRLSEKYPEMTVLEAMREDKLIPPRELCFPAVLENDDPIVKNIKNLSVSEKLADSYEYEKWSEQLSKIKRDFSVLWNKPLNFLSYNKAEVFCGYAVRAGGAGDKNTFGYALDMLSFCAEQLCAGEDKYESLAVILDYGEKITEISENIFSIIRKHGTESTDRFNRMYVDMHAMPPSRLSLEKKIELEIDKANFDNYSNSLETYRVYVESLKSKMKLHKISNEEIEKVRGEIEKQLNHETAKAESFNAERSAGALEEIERTEEYDEENLGYIEEDDSCEFPDKILKKTLYKDM